LTSGVDGILLAAGESRRMGFFPKPLLKIGDETYLTHLAAAILPAVDRLIIVIGAHAARVRPAVPADPRITIVDNPDFARGQLSSLKRGLTAVTPAARAALVHLIDHPKVAPATFREVVEAFPHGQRAIVIARYQGRRGHPVVFSRSVFAELLRAPEEQGAKVVVNADPARVGYVDTNDPGVLLDLDTPDDVARAGLTRPDKSAGVTLRRG
jgi:molybdenum cofactor cytidylyltransferase